MDGIWNSHNLKSTRRIYMSGALIRIITYLYTAIGLSPGGSGYFTCKQNMKSVTNKFKSGGGYMRSM